MAAERQSTPLRPVIDLEIPRVWAVWDSVPISWPEAYAAADALCTELRNTARHQSFGWAALTRGRIAAYRQEFAEAQVIISEGLGRLILAGDSYGTVVAEALLAIPLITSGDLERAVRFSLKPWSTDQKFEPSDAELLHSISAQCYWALGDHHSALLHLSKAYNLVCTCDLRFRRVAVMQNTAAVLMQIGKFDAALAMSIEARDFETKTIGTTNRQNGGLFNIVACLVELGRTDQLRVYMREVFDLLMTDEPLAILLLHNACAGFAMLGDVDNARLCLDRQRMMALSNPSNEADLMLKASQAYILEAAGDFAQASKIARTLYADPGLTADMKRSMASLLSRAARSSGRSAEAARWKRMQCDIGDERVLESLMGHALRPRNTTTPAVALSEQELLCLRLSARGQTSADIALKMGIKPRTVNFHFSKVLKKFNAMNRQEAIAKAAAADLLPDL